MNDNKAFHGNDFDKVAERISMLKKLQLSIKQSLGINAIDGKAELEKVASDDMELNEKDERTIISPKRR